MPRFDLHQQRGLPFVLFRAVAGGTRHTPVGVHVDGSPTPAENKEFSALDRRREAVSSPRSCFDTLLSALKPYRDVFVESKRGDCSQVCLLLRAVVSDARSSRISVALDLGRGVPF